MLLLLILPPMNRLHALGLAVAIACTWGCKKEEKPLLSANLHAQCRGCVVSYAAGVAQSRQDTVFEVVDPGTGDTLPGTGSWTVHLKDGDNLFFRACRLYGDSALHGDILIQVDGEVRPLQASADTSLHCTEINRTVQGS